LLNENLYLEIAIEFQLSSKNPIIGSDERQKLSLCRNVKFES